MKQGEQYILQRKDKTVESEVFKDTILEVTNTTIYIKVENSEKTMRFLNKQFDEKYRIIEKLNIEL